MNKFQQFKEKKILIYGTGKIAARLIESLSGFHIIGVIDRVYAEGYFEGIPILTWDDIKRNMADIIILGASKVNYQSIFERIQYRCIALGINIYGENGRNLMKDYQMKYMESSHMRYFQKNGDELKGIIDSYDAISFDLFDTLIMRKVLEPTDIFAIVEEKLKCKKIQVADFKKKRRTAEIQFHNPKISQIYDRLKELTKMNEEEKMIAMETEIQCEKQCLVPRVAMVEIMNYAIENGKKVNIISDMYLPASVLEPFLKKMGIEGYQKLYVSCDYGAGKGSGIFKIYRRDVGDVKCLHIGDNINSDVMIPQKYGIDTYEIKSAIDMLKMSSLRRLLFCSGKINNHVALGLVLAELLNDPFALYKTAGFVPIKQQQVLAKLFIAPSVLIYMQTLAQIIHAKKYEAILFTARDGYLLKKIYEAQLADKYHIPAVYFLASRKLSLASTIVSVQAVLGLCKWFQTKEKLGSFLKEMFTESEFFLYEAEGNLEETLISVSDKLIYYSDAIRKNYKKYADNLHIDWSKKYLLCDLNSSGTVQNALNEIFSTDLDGLYLCRKGSSRKINVVSVYDERDGADFTHAVDLLETILTSNDPSVKTMDEEGSPIYTEEKRTKSELIMVQTAQNAIMEYVQQYDEIIGIEKNIDSYFPEIVLGLIDSVKYESETEFLERLQHMDDLNQISTAVLK